MASSFELIIRPRKGWQPVDFKEIFLYRELLGFLVWRDIKIRYRQTLLGGLWAVLQPLIAMLIFTFVFHRLAGVKSDGPPYPLFAFAGLAAWTFFSTAVSQSSNSLVSNQHLVSKVYFPRVFIPVGRCGSSAAGPRFQPCTSNVDDDLLSLADLPQTVPIAHFRSRRRSFRVGDRDDAVRPEC